MMSSRPGGSALRILTFNIGNGLAEPGALIEMLRSEEWDLVALQEVSKIRGEALERELSDSSPHRVIHAGGVAGKALLPLQTELES